MYNNLIYCAIPNPDMPKAPCQNCPDRHVKCHGSCEKYQAYKQEMDDAKAIQSDYKRGHKLPKDVWDAQIHKIWNRQKKRK